MRYFCPRGYAHETTHPCRGAAAALAFALLLCGCSGAETSDKAPQRAAVESGERQFAQPSDGDFIAIFSTSLGEVRAVLYPDAAPMAVQNFVGLAAAATMIIR